MEVTNYNKDELGHTHRTSEPLKYTFKETKKNIKSWKDEAITSFTDGINAERKGTKWKPITEKRVAIKINRHPSLKDSQQECRALYKRCLREGFVAFNATTKGL